VLCGPAPVGSMSVCVYCVCECVCECVWGGRLNFMLPKRVEIKALGQELVNGSVKSSCGVRPHNSCGQQVRVCACVCVCVFECV